MLTNDKNSKMENNKSGDFSQNNNIVII